MRHLDRGWWIGALVAAIVSVTSLAAAQPPDRQQCDDAYEKAQVLRRQRQLRAAREQLLVCNAAECPSFENADCAQWLRDVESALPSVVFVVRDAAGKDVLDVKVSMDGEPIADGLGSEAVVVEPGEHVFKYEPKGGAPFEEKILVREGEKARVLHVTLAGAEPKRKETPPAGPDRPPPRTGSLVPTLVAGGVGVASLAVAIVTGAMAHAEYDSLTAQNCAPNCAPSDVSTIRTYAIVSDVMTGVGIVGLGFATYFLISYLSSPHATAAPKHAWQLVPALGAGSAGLTLGRAW